MSMNINHILWDINFEASLGACCPDGTTIHSSHSVLSLDLNLVVTKEASSGRWRQIR